MNSTLRKSLLYNKMELNGIPLNHLLLTKQKLLKSNEISKFLKQIRTENKRIAFFYITKNKKEIPVEGFGINLGDKEENLYLLIANDISEKHRLQIELKDLRTELNETLSKYPELKLWSITQKKEPLELVDRSIKELKNSQKNFQEILENITEGYFDLDINGNFTFVNRGLCMILGFSKEDLLGRNYKEILDLKEEKKIDQIIEEGLKEDSYEFEIKRKDGNKIIIETSLVFRKEKEIVVGYFGIFRDITSRKKIELLEKKFREELEFKVNDRTKELKNALDLQKKLMDEILKTSQFKSEFLANFSHELRTPLNVIIGFTDLLLEQEYGKLGNDQKIFLEDVKDSSDYLLSLIDNILDLSRIESGELEIRKKEFELENFIGQIKSTFNPLFLNKNLSFKIEKGDNIQKIKTDPIRLKQILYNLLSNAYKFTFNGEVILKIKENNENWKFIIKDTGIGIEQKDHELIFKEFKRVNSDQVNKIPGSGLGLPLTKRLVNLLGGSIVFESKPGKGSTFRVYLPK